MADYHVGTGEITGEIYAGVLTKDGKKWCNRSIVTDAAICAVRDHLINQANQNNQDWFGYEWSRKDGKKVTLALTIKKDKDDPEQSK